MSDLERISPAILREPAPRGTLALTLAGVISWRDGITVKREIHAGLLDHGSVNPMIEAGKGLTVVFDLARVTAFHEHALEELHSVSLEVVKRCGTIVFTHVSESVREQLRASRLLNVFSAYAGERPGADPQRSML